MTAQIGDEFMIQDRSYTMVALSNPIPFHPKEYGITVESRCTACWRGFWCVYDLSDDELILRDLYVNAKDMVFPEINGVSIQEKEDYLGHFVYSNLRLPISYTGKILVGDGFLWEYYIHMGFQRPWAYKTLLEFIFEEGILLDTVDRSNMARHLRNEIKKHPTTFYEKMTNNLPSYLVESFSADMSIKAWWFK